MSQSKKLSENINQHSVKNVESQLQDIKIKEVVNDVIDSIRVKYPNHEFGVDSKLMLRTIEKMVSEGYTTQENTYIQPDGGFVWMNLNNKKHYILVSEQKRQGTNDRRLSEGKEKQSKGNAGERLGKNVIGIELLFGNEEIMPFVVFLQGCDFYDEESTIGDRIRTIAKFQQFNVVNVYWKQIMKKVFCGGSYFMRGHSYNDNPGTSDWTYEEMFNAMMEIAETSIKYYMENYGE